MILKVRPFSCVYFLKIYHRKTRLDIMVLMMNYKYDNPQSLLRVILCQINRFENKPLTEDILYFFYLFFVFQSINNIKNAQYVDNLQEKYVDDAYMDTYTFLWCKALCAVEHFVEIGQDCYAAL